MLRNYFTLVFICCFFSFTNAQYTYIADSRFEQALIALGIDTDGVYHQVLTSSIVGVTYLDVRSKMISDLTGIEGFTNLSTLLCDDNYLTSLDLSQNTALTKVVCYENNITSIDVSGSPNLDLINCDLNQLTSLDLSQNPIIKTVKCFSNHITSLDLTQNTSLTYLRCASNQLTSLNVKNGQNALITNFDAINNSSLSCLDVDNETLANSGQAPYTNWEKDASAVYSEDCSALGLDDKILAKSIVFYPNPVTDVLTINSPIISITKVEIYSIIGKRVKEIQSNFETIKTNDLSKGVYLVRIYSDKGDMVKKLIKK